MDQAIYQMPTLNEAKNAVEIVVHVSDNLEDQQRRNLVAALEQEDGIVSAEFCPLRYHLMLVRYDRGQYSSQDVLRAVGAQKIRASLIGPI
jgi:cell division protein FtsX